MQRIEFKNKKDKKNKKNKKDKKETKDKKTQENKSSPGYTQQARPAEANGSAGGTEKDGSQPPAKG